MCQARSDLELDKYQPISGREAGTKGPLPTLSGMYEGFKSMLGVLLTGHARRRTPTRGRSKFSRLAVFPLNLFPLCGATVFNITMTPPPKPFHLLRIHAAPLATLTFNADNTLLLAGDQDGYVSVTDLRSRRVVRYWKAHEGGVLGVDEYDGAVVRWATHLLFCFLLPHLA